MKTRFLLVLLLGASDALATEPAARSKPALELTDGDIDFRGVLISPDGKLVAARGRDNVIRVWSLATRKLLHRLDERPRTMSGSAMAFTRDSKSLLVSSWRFNRDNSKLVERRLTWWDPLTGKRVRTLEGDAKPNGPFLQAPDGRMMATGGNDEDDGHLYLRDPLTAKVLRKLDPPNGWRELAFSPDGKRMLTVNRTDDIDSWDLATGKRSEWLRQDPKIGRIGKMAFSPCGRRLALYADGKGGRLAILDGRTGKEVASTATLPGSSPIFLFARKGEWLVAAFGVRVYVYDGRTGGQLFRCRIWGPCNIAGMSLSPCHRWLATVAQHEECVKLWKIADW